MSLESASLTAQLEQLSAKNLPVEQIAYQYRKKVFASMLESRGSKYGFFLGALRSVKYFPSQRKRGNFLETYYAIMRYIDDVVDGDTDVPERYPSASSFVERKIEYAQKPGSPSDSTERMMEYCFRLGDSFGQDFTSETADILGSLHFDAQRREKPEPEVFPKQALQHHFHLLDTRGTIAACLKLANEPHTTYEDLEPLGDASRIYYTLRDIPEDANAGLINVPAEDMRDFGIASVTELQTGSPSVTRWIRAEAERGIALLQQHRARLPDLRMKKLVKAGLYWVYERPARKFFTKALSPTA